MSVSNTSLGGRAEAGPGIKRFNCCSEDMNCKLDFGIKRICSPYTKRFWFCFECRLLESFWDIIWVSVLLCCRYAVQWLYNRWPYQFIFRFVVGYLGALSILYLSVLVFSIISWHLNSNRNLNGICYNVWYIWHSILFSFLTLKNSFIDLNETKMPDVAKVSFYGFEYHIHIHTLSNLSGLLIFLE